ncbi:MAG: transglycosylase SLT domain-containing protein [Actinomycetales bacterium]|nr:transglycosylase SLT domain-containing protein [Actinomycetales bacterium]
MIRGVLAATGVGLVALPAVAIVAALAVGGGTCVAAAGGALAADAPVPAEARVWVAETVAACPELPESWVAAVMAQESGFRPDAYADDANGGTWGLFQLNASVWARAYGHPWSADLDGDGIWDVREGDIHARVAGEYLCARLDGVRTIRAEHPDWASSALPELDALIIAHNAGESRLRTYPVIPEVTKRFIQTVDARAAAWSSVAPLAGADASAATGEPTNAPVPATSYPLRQAGTGCIADAAGSSAGVEVPPGSPHDVDTAVQTALSYVGVTSGWAGLCDRLACRAYGYASSGYATASAHWQEMLDSGKAHPGDTCAPLGSFVFFDTGRPAGHVSIVVKASPTCDLDATLVTSNETYDYLTGYDGGVYVTRVDHLDALYARSGVGYLGWAEPVCRGDAPADTVKVPVLPGR